MKKKDMQHYDKIVAVYDDQYREEQERKYKVALNSVNILKSDCLLDLGCGTGLFAEVAKLGGHVVAIDHSKNMIKEAKQKYNNEQISFLCADVDNMPFVEGTFDTIFSFTVLQNAPDPKKTVLSICPVSKSGSKVVLSVPKKAFTHSSFLHILAETRLSIVEFIDEGELKDYIAICRIL